MRYQYPYIYMSDDFVNDSNMYILSLIDARYITFIHNGLPKTLSGKYLFCLSEKNIVENATGEYKVKSLCFVPYFFEIYPSTAETGHDVNGEPKKEYVFNDLHLFNSRNADHNGIINLSYSEYENLFMLFSITEQHIEERFFDTKRLYSIYYDLTSILRIADAIIADIRTGTTDDVLQYIRDNPGSDLSLNALCSKFNTNRTTLADSIKKNTGISPGKYVLSERLNQTRYELLNTALSVSEIAVKFGFNDPNRYIRAFRQKYGTTPLQYRKNRFEDRKEEKSKRQNKKDAGVLTVEKFTEYLARGLGTAIIYLRRESDTSRFRDAFKNYVIGKQWKDIHNTFEYEDELLSCFEDPEAIKDEIAEHCIAKGVRVLPYHVKLLKRWGYGDRIEKSLKETYEELYGKLFAATDSVSDKSLYELFDRPCFVDSEFDEKLFEKKLKASSESQEISSLIRIYLDYKEAFIGYAAFYETKETEKRLIDNEFEMRAKTGYVPPSPATDIFFWCFHEDPEIRKYLIDRLPRDYFRKYDTAEVNCGFLRPSEIEILDADYFIDKETYSFEDKQAFHSEYLPPLVVRRVNREILNCKDKQKRSSLFELFSDRELYYEGAADDLSLPDPLTAARLLPEFKEAVETNPDAFSTSLFAEYVMCCREKTIKEYAAELIDKNIQKFNAIRSYFLYNYKKDDRGLFAKKLSETETESRDHSIYAWIFGKCIERKIKKLPLEMALTVFRNCSDAPKGESRLSFIRSLYIGGVYDEQIIEEASHDLNKEIREYAELMREKKPYIEIKWLNFKTASDYMDFFDKIESEGCRKAIGLDRHLTKEEFEKFFKNPITDLRFCDIDRLSASIRTRLYIERRISGYIAYVDKEPVGFIDCGDREKYVYLNNFCDEGEDGEFVITAPITNDDRVMTELIRRAVKYAEEDHRPVVKVYLEKQRELNAYQKAMEVFIDLGFEVLRQDAENTILIKKQTF